MLKAKYTKGDWRISNLQKKWNEAFKVFAGSRQVAQVSTDGARNDSTETAANAILMSQSPKMLQLLLSLVQLEEEYSKACDELKDPDPSNIEGWSRLQDVEARFQIKKCELFSEIEEFLEKVKPDLFDEER